MGVLEGWWVNLNAHLYQRGKYKRRLAELGLRISRKQLKARRVSNLGRSVGRLVFIRYTYYLERNRSDPDALRI